MFLIGLFVGLLWGIIWCFKYHISPLQEQNEELTIGMHDCIKSGLIKNNEEDD